MAEKRPPSESNESDERRQLLIRIVSAGVVILVLLVGLVMWERKARAPSAPEPAASVPGPALASPPLAQSAPLGLPATTQSPAAPAVQSAPVSSASDVIEETQPPTIAEADAPELPPGPEGSVPRLPPKPAVAVVPVKAPLASAPTSKASEPAPRAVPPRPAVVDAGVPRLVIQADPAPSGLTPPTGRAFALQAGVFANATNAEELRAKLTLAGIPSQVETRVLVGPFKTRQESFVAQNKLKAMGLDRSQLVTVKQQ